MRAWRQLVVFMLFAASLLQVAAFLERADECRYMRRAAADRPECCDYGGKDRLTDPGGDCCRYLWLAEDLPATSDSLVEVPSGSSAFAPRPAYAMRSGWGAPFDPFRARIERPPPRRNPARHIVVLN